MYVASFYSCSVNSTYASGLSRQCAPQQLSFCNTNVSSSCSRSRKQRKCINLSTISLTLSLKRQFLSTRISTVKTHKDNIAAKEREVLAREASLLKKESHITSLLSQKDSEILSLQNVISQFQEQAQFQYDNATVEKRIRDAISKREEELRIAVMKREEEVAMAMARREEEIMHAVRQREEEIFEACRAREEQIREEIMKALEERTTWVEQKTEELLDQCEISSPETTKLSTTFATPINRHIAKPSNDVVPSAMKGIIFTSTGETLATPTPGELAKLFVDSPKVGLNFTKIFDFDDDPEAEIPPMSPTMRERSRADKASNPDEANGPEPSVPIVPPTRLRRPSILRQRPSMVKVSPVSSASCVSGQAGSSRSHAVQSATLPQPSTSSAPAQGKIIPVPYPKPPTEYDFSDEENLPSPFLKRVERGEVLLPSSGSGKSGKPTRRMSNGNILRAVAAANTANINAGGTGRKKGGSISVTPNPDVIESVVSRSSGERPLLVSARKASEEARKVLLRS